MQLLLLLLPPFAFVVCQAESRSSSSEEKVVRRWKFNTTVSPPNITAEAKRQLAEEMGGIDLEARRARLSRLHARNLTDAQKAKLKARLEKVRPVKINKPEEGNTVEDIFEVNRKAGLDKYMYEADINLTEDQIDEIEAEQNANGGASRVKRQASLKRTKWTNTTVFYYFDSSLPQRNVDSVRKALGILQAHTCVNFIEDETAKNKVKVLDGKGCHSSVGMTGGTQTVSLGEGCSLIGQSAHEFTHTLGFGHEQSRADRDDFVTVDLTNVRESARGNFGKQGVVNSGIFTPYEYSSNMHYAANYFTSPDTEQSMVPEDPRYAYGMGGRQISFYDFQMINALYGCLDVCNKSSTVPDCKNDGVPNPRNCSKCICPGGYGGDLCDQRPEGCGETLTATTSPSSLLITVGIKTSGQKSRDDHLYCNYWIQVPAGYNLQVKLISMKHSHCQYGCTMSGIEVKGDLNQQITNPRYCCEEFLNTTITSYVNPTPVRAYNAYYYSQYKIEYVAVPSSEVPPPPTPPPLKSQNTTSTSTTTTTTLLVVNECKSYLNSKACKSRANSGWCTDYETNNWQTIKYNCGVECGLCGLAAPNCHDLRSSSYCKEYKAAGNCTTGEPMLSEWFCAKSCGYCGQPN